MEPFSDFLFHCLVVLFDSQEFREMPENPKKNKTFKVKWNVFKNNNENFNSITDKVTN